MDITTNLSDFGQRELIEVELLLKAMRINGLPKDFENDEVHPMFNISSGNVFLTNSEYQVAMEDNGKLYSFYSCPVCGEEGSLEDIDGHSDDKECKEFVDGLKGE